MVPETSASEAVAPAPAPPTTETTPKKSAGLKPPPPEKPADVRRRSYIVLSFWVIVILLGIPFWWATTSIYRADLPYDDMLQWANGKVRIPLGSCPLGKQLLTFDCRPADQSSLCKSPSRPMTSRSKKRSIFYDSPNTPSTTSTTSPATISVSDSSPGQTHLPLRNPQKTSLSRRWRSS